jgi:glycosyltransferase involved in cell wall biosynthesis
MKKIKVYLQYPWKVSDSQYYKSLLDFPPKGVKYSSNINSFGTITNKKKFFLNLIKRNIRKIIEFLNIPITNSKITEFSEKFDLIHCAHCLSRNNSPWIADFEAPWQFWISGKNTKWGKQKVKEILMNPNCKMLVAWTKQARKELIEIYPELEKKIKVLYYGQPSKNIKKQNHQGINLLFIGRYFYLKGGLHALEAINRITNENKEVRGIIVSNTPKEIIKKYSKNKNIQFFPLMSRDNLFRNIYPLSDIFVYPGYSDTFGFAFTEAMSFGLPIITVKGYAREELVSNGKTGFIIPYSKRIDIYNVKDETIIKEIINKTNLLIKEKKLMKNMSINCQKIIKEGYFSIKYRNKNLLKIYKEAIK